MNTFILTWGPRDPDERHGYSDGGGDPIELTASGRMVRGSWTTGNRNRLIQQGDRAFLLRQRSEHGIVAAGRFLSTDKLRPDDWPDSVVYPDEHWNGSGDEANYAEIEWEHWLPPEDRLDIEMLPPTRGVSWNTLRVGGIHVPDPGDAAELEALWEKHLKSVGRSAPIRLPDEVEPGVTFPEGTVTRIEVNRYERDPRARAACLHVYGYDCAVCGFNFERSYGSIGISYIHVHHLRELSSLGPDDEVDPVEDLRPICPNCHAMAHRQRPALTVEELQALIRAAKH